MIRLKDYEKYKNLNYLKFLCRKVVFKDTFKFDSLLAFTIETDKLKGKFSISNSSKILLINIYSRKENDILNQLPDSLMSLKMLIVGRVSKKIDFSKISTYNNLRELYLNSKKLDSIPSIITKLNSLKELTLNFDLNANTISVLKQINTLEDLGIHYDKKTDYSMIKELPNLKKIRIYGKLPDSVFENIKYQFPKIEVVRYR